MKTSTYRKQLVTRYEKKSTEELISIYESLVKELVKSFNGIADYEKLTKIHIKSDVLNEIIDNKQQTI